MSTSTDRSTNPNREGIVRQRTWDWDVDSGTKASMIQTKIPGDIDPEGQYKAITGGGRGAGRTAITPLPMDVPDPRLDLLILLRMLHQRSPEEPPAHFLEGEEVEDAESDEGDVGSASASVLTTEVTEVNVAALGLADNGAGAGAEPEFVSVLELHVPAAGPIGKTLKYEGPEEEPGAVACSVQT